jgi:uncharacterized small protein (DUF1192 family)
MLSAIELANTSKELANIRALWIARGEQLDAAAQRIGVLEAECERLQALIEKFEAQSNAAPTGEKQCSKSATSF